MGLSTVQAPKQLEDYAEITCSLVGVEGHQAAEQTVVVIPRDMVSVATEAKESYTEMVEQMLEIGRDFYLFRRG